MGTTQVCEELSEDIIQTHKVQATIKYHASKLNAELPSYASFDFGDCQQHLSITAIHCVRKFDSGRDTQFVTFLSAALFRSRMKLLVRVRRGRRQPCPLWEYLQGHSVSTTQDIDAFELLHDLPILIRQLPKKTQKVYRLYLSESERMLKEQTQKKKSKQGTLQERVSEKVYLNKAAVYEHRAAIRNVIHKYTKDR